MSLSGRFRAALGRDDASLLARARGDVRMGLGLNPPGCLPPLNRAIASLERLPAGPEVTLLLARALRAKAEAVQGTLAHNLRARAVAKLRAALDAGSLAEPDRAALLAALAQAWRPLDDDLRDPDLSYRQLLRAAEAAEQALVLPSAAGHLGMAEIALALAHHPRVADAAIWRHRVHHHVQAARRHRPDPDQTAQADMLESAAGADEGPGGP